MSKEAEDRLVKFESWLTEVEQHLRDTNHGLYVLALSTGPYDGVKSMRGDEPEDCFDMGDRPQQYGDYLLNEWLLYGPEGE